MRTPKVPALWVSNLYHIYGEKVVLENVTSGVAAGECAILLGPNGAGKTTLFSLITRLYESRMGLIEIVGYDLRQHSSLAMSRLGVVFQQSTLDLDLSVERNLLYHAALHGLSKKQAMVNIRDELERQGMYERRHEKVRELNGGHRRRVEIARALLHNPEILLLDEPTVGLDMPSRRAIVEYVHLLAAYKKIAVLWATHLVDEIYETDRLIILHQGKIRLQGSVAQVLEKTRTNNIANAFQQLTRE
ncbi:MAG: ABC transporter ATP-binding protein [Methylococcaceae bacterium]|nr:ABC transporter ATP-binding protein [Methylococcaceae bacterium]